MKTTLDGDCKFEINSSRWVQLVNVTQKRSDMIVTSATMNQFDNASYRRRGFGQQHSSQSATAVFWFGSRCRPIPARVTKSIMTNTVIIQARHNQRDNQRLKDMQDQTLAVYCMTKLSWSHEKAADNYRSPPLGLYLWHNLSVSRDKFKVFGRISMTNDHRQLVFQLLAAAVVGAAWWTKKSSVFDVELAI